MLGVVIFSALLALSLRSLLTDKPAADDERENLTIAYNLAYHGAYSLGTNPADGLPPTNYREPLPLYVLALHIKLHPLLASGLTAHTLNQGSAIRTLKTHNLIWAFLCLVGVALTTARLLPPTRLRPPALIIVLLLTYAIFLRHHNIDLLATEIQAATLLIGTTLASISALRSGHWRWFVVAGLGMAALTLTKASFLPISIAYTLVLLLRALLKPPAPSTRRQAIQNIGLMGAAGLGLLMPWLIRNYAEFGTVETTQRGGHVLLVRAYKNQASPLGGFYAYAPPPLRPLVGWLTGYAADDLEDGGRLASLNREDDSSFAEADRAAVRAGQPDAVISWYRKAMAERVRLIKSYADQGTDDPSRLADRAMQRQAIGLIRNDPLSHLMMTPPFMWRGLWCMGNSRAATPLLVLMGAINVLAYGAVWGMALVGLWRWHPEIMGIAVLPVGAMCFFALATHYIPRYSDPLIPNMLVALVVAGAWGVEWLIAPQRRWMARWVKQQEPV